MLRQWSAVDDKIAAAAIIGMVVHHKSCVLACSTCSTPLHFIAFVLCHQDTCEFSLCLLQVAQVLVESVLQSSASNKVVEIVAGKQVEQTSPDKWFANL